jgi:hypothetical protein
MENIGSCEKMNWNNRVNNYRKELSSLYRGGWLSKAEFDKYWGSKTDSQFQSGINIGNRNKSIAAANIERNAGLARTGGLPRPGNVISDEYYQKYLGVSKKDLMNVKNFHGIIMETIRGQDRYKVDKPSISDVEYVIRQKWESEYDPGYARNSLSGNRAWELKSQYVEQYADYARKNKPETFSLPRRSVKDIERSQTILSSWSKKGKFPGELRSVSSLSGSRSEILNPMKKTGLRGFGSMNADRIVARSQSDDTDMNKIVPISVRRNVTSNNKMATSVTKRKSKGTGLIARRL